METEMLWCTFSTCRKIWHVENVPHAALHRFSKQHISHEAYHDEQHTSQADNSQ